MSDFALCPTCRKYDFLEKHRCEPIFYFKHESWGDEFQPIHASDFEDAAVEFARKYNEGNGDYSLMNGDTEEVVISDGKTEKTFIVRAEQAIDYYADEKEIK